MDKINHRLLRENEALVNGIDALCSNSSPDEVIFYVRVKVMVKTWLDGIGFKEPIAIEYAPDVRLITLYTTHPSELIGEGYHNITSLESLYFHTFGEFCEVEVNDIVGAVISPSNKE